jgi:hypothetical protein
MLAPGFRRLLPVLSLWYLLAPVPPAVAQTPAASSAHAAKVPASDKFKSVAAAAAHCPSDTVVWSTFSSSHVYHLAASKYYGKTKHGAYVCEKDAVAFGYHASKR